MIGSALVVDSDPVQLAATARALAELDYDVVLASSFEDANRHLAAADSLSLLVADVRLGQYNGLHLAFRTRSRHPNIQVVITDRVFDATLEAETKRIGGVYTTKPVTANQIAAFIARLSEPAGAGSRPARRWPPQPVMGGLIASVEAREARLLDISYGGVCLELSEADFSAALPSTMDVLLPTSGLSLRVHPVWARAAASSAAWLCGGEVIASDQPSLMEWQHFVDSCPA